MVCVQESGVGHDFRTDPLELLVDGDWVKARGTTLGGDNGIAVAVIMALMDDESVAHPPIEAVFTVDEEIGLLGANGLDCSDLEGRKLINLDSEDEGVLTVSCAGGVRCDIGKEFALEEAKGVVCALTISGGQGGHSGTEINKGLANANKLLAQCLGEIKGIQLISLSGGLQDNAIPKEADAVFLVEDPVGLDVVRERFETEIRGVFGAAEPTLAVMLRTVPPESRQALSAADSQAVLALLNEYPNGVQAMSEDIPGLVQTSLNLGILRLKDGKLEVSSSVRSSVAAEKDELCRRLERLAARYGAWCSQRGAYPPWEYRKDSALRDTMLQVYQRMNGQEMKVEALHAGLECGLFAGKIEGLDAVSIGPDLKEVHSTRERLSVSSVQRTWAYMVEVLKEL